MNFDNIPSNFGSIQWQSIAITVNEIKNASEQNDVAYLEKIAQTSNKTIQEVIDWAEKTEKLIEQMFGK